MVGDPPRPIEPLFHLHVRGPNRVVNLIELSFMRNRTVLPEAAGSLDAPTPGQVADPWRGPMEIGLLGGRHRKPLVVARQIALQDPIGVLHGHDPRPSEFLDQPILQRLKQPFHPALGLRRVGCKQFHA